MMKAVPMSFVMCVAVATLSASMNPPVDVNTRARGAQRVVVASVVDAYSTFGVTPQGDRVIVTHTQLQVEETLKGASAQLVALTIEGGTVGDITMRVSDMSPLRKGDRGVFFLDSDQAGGNRPHGRGLGILKLDANNRIAGSDLSLGQVKTLVRGAVNGGQR